MSFHSRSSLVSSPHWHEDNCGQARMIILSMSLFKVYWSTIGLLSAAYWVVPSAWRLSDETGTVSSMSVIKMLNNKGLRRLPWGTPQRGGDQLEHESLHITRCLRLSKYDVIIWRAGSCTPYAFNFARSKLWQMRSKAFDRSMAATLTSFFSSRARLQSWSVNLINAVAQECPLRKPDILREKFDAKEVYSWPNITFSKSLETAERELTGR